MRNSFITNNKLPARSRSKGFSLIEMLIVVGIIALIVGMMVGNFGSIFEDAEAQTAQAFVDASLETPLMKFKMDMGSYPTSAQGLKALLNNPGGKKAKRWKGPYIKDAVVDPWKNEYQYRFPATKNSRGYDLWSLGPDGVESEDDIGNWGDSN